MTITLAEPIRSELARLEDGSRILLLGQRAHTYAPALTELLPGVVLTCQPQDVSLDLLDSVGRSNLAIMSDLQAWDSRALAEQHIARLRDRNTARLLVEQSAQGTQTLTRADCLALGLRGPVTTTAHDTSRNWYSYSIIDYKLSPDWLNADNWANPDRWNRERW